MRIHRFSAVVSPVLALALLAAGTSRAGSLGADEPAAPPPVDSGWSGPPPAAPAPVPTADPIPPAAPTSAAPTAPAGSLPPPVVRRGGQRVSLPSTAPAASMQPAAPTTTWVPTGVTAPAAPAMPAAPALPEAPSAPATPAFSAPGEAPIVEAPTAPSALGTEASIVHLIKEHNVPLPDGTFALRLRTKFRVDAPAGGRYRVWITFFDRATGLPLRSTRPGFADAQGHAHCMTKPVDSGGRGQEFDAPLGIPYAVFPDPGQGKVTDIEARVELTRVTGTQEVPVATSSTTFKVHGPGAPLSAEPVPVTSFPAPK